MTPSPNRFRHVLLGLLIVCWSGAFTLTHVPLPAVETGLGGDKAMHLVGYLGLGVLALLTAAAYGIPRTNRGLKVLLILAAYGVFDELTQRLVNRHASVYDWLADVAGVLCALALVGGVSVAMQPGRRKEEPGDEMTSPGSD